MKENVLLCATILIFFLMLICAIELDKYLELKYKIQAYPTTQEMQMKVINLETRVRLLERVLIKKYKK